MLTWFSHSVSNFDTVQRIFDFILASDDATMPLFISGAIVLWTKPHLLNGSVDCEYSAVHSFYSKLFSDIPMELNVEADDPRLCRERYFAIMVDENLESILAHAHQLRMRHSTLLSRPEAKAFLERAHLNPPRESYPKVAIPKRLPYKMRRPIETFQYRFEGVRRQREAALQKKRRRIHAYSLFFLVGAMVVVAMIIMVMSGRTS